MNYKGYTIAESHKTGGKAGKGNNRTASIQVREEMGEGYLLKKAFSYSLDREGAKEEAIQKAKDYIDNSINKNEAEQEVHVTVRLILSMDSALSKLQIQDGINAGLKEAFPDMQDVSFLDIKEEGEIYQAEEDSRIEELKSAFIQVIQAWITAEDRTTIDLLNKNETDKNVCHTHDFCDANMAMDEAFQDVFDREFNLNSQDDMNMVNLAWDKAKEQGFSVNID